MQGWVSALASACEAVWFIISSGKCLLFAMTSIEPLRLVANIYRIESAES